MQCRYHSTVFYCRKEAFGSVNYFFMSANPKSSAAKLSILSNLCLTSFKVAVGIWAGAVSIIAEGVV